MRIAHHSDISSPRDERSYVMRSQCVLSIALKLLMRVRKKFVRALIEISVAVF
jgi:hypothetical protein